MATMVKSGKELRCGYTTGSCAAAAAAATTEMLLSGKEVPLSEITLPRGEKVLFEIENILWENGRVSCGVFKDAGDDPDVTNGMEIRGAASFCESGVQITGGKGVGVVTSGGLQCPMGEAAINPVPRKMIREAVEKIRERYSCNRGIVIEISAVNGEEIAKKTFNPRLGIEGGISILGTTGIVEPMSEQALVDTIRVLIDKASVRNPDEILLSPGNYGRDYCLRQMGFDLEDGVKFSNFVGETLDYLVYRGFKSALLVGHVGKLVKLAGGVMNTHSAVADCRMEILAAHLAMAGGSRETVERIMDCKTTDEAILLLEESGFATQVFTTILEKMQFHIDCRTKGSLKVELLVFTTGERVLMETKGAAELAQRLKER